MTGIASFQVETILNDRPATIHVQDRRRDLFEVQLSFEFVILSDGQVADSRYANCIGISTVTCLPTGMDRTDPLGLDHAERDAAIIEVAGTYVAARQAEFDNRFVREKEEIDEFVGQIDEKLARRAELESIIAARLEPLVTGEGA